LKISQSRQVCAQAYFVFKLEVTKQPWPTHVGADNECSLARKRQYRGQVNRSEGFAFTANRTCDEENCLFLFSKKVVQVRSQCAKSFREGALWTVEYFQIITRPLVAKASDKRYRCKLFNVFARLNAG